MSDSNAWRDARPRKCGLCGTQWPTERLELVELVISTGKRVSFEQRRNHALSAQCEGVDLSVRVAELEALVERQNETIAKLQARRAS